MHSRRTIHHFGLMAVLVALPAGCEIQPVERPELRDPNGQQPTLRTGWKERGSLTYRSVSFGGKPPVGPFEAGDSNWHDEKHWLILGVAGYPGKPKGPVVLVIARVPPGSEPDGRNVSDVQNIFTIQSDLNSNLNRRALMVWALRKDMSESMQIGGKEYDLKQGRVFLVDAVGKSVSAHQINADLGGTFVAPGPNYDKLGAELELLLEKDVKVKRFWMGDDPNAEDS
jgi:hypothetical protein